MRRSQAIEELNFTFECCDIDDFPNIPIRNPEAILKAGIKVIKPNTSKYNCWAYALQVTNKWLDLEDYSGNDIDSMFLMTSRYGFVHVPEMDFDFDPSVRKVVFYTKDSDEVTHAALRVKDGWKSKFGRASLLFHPSLDMIGRGMYGEPTHMFQRRI